jgi:predicted ATPase/DNA-binding winged helix-turn-helix (wHTH) protein
MPVRRSEALMTEPTCFHFADFALYPGRRALLRNGVPVEIGSRAMDVLLALVRRHGEVATKSAIMADVWPGTVVEENNLTTQIATVRRVLGGASGDTPGADPGGSRFILTIPGRGYRFIADVIAVMAEDPAQETAPVPERPQDTERTNLPLQSSSFIGRERELAEIRARLGTRALVTLVGAGGVGKTRTALQLAAGMVDQFADGVFLLELAPLADGNLVAESLCRLLGVPATGDRPPEAVAIAMLRHKAMLLVLDNCEHVLEGAASLVAAILRHCPQLRILATSREALSISGESVFLMPSLAVPSVSPTLTAAVALRSDAVRLFAERAADALGTYTLSDEDAQAVATICRRLDGVPLATELAAARLRMLNPSEIAARLENVFRLLTGGSRTALPRQQTLRATIDWSFSLLSPQEQIVLRRLAVFPDGCSADGATAVAGGDGIDPDEVFDLVSALVAKSLMVADSGSKTTRYRMLETTRQYATEKLRQAGEADRERRKAEYLLAFFRRAEAAWPTMGTDAWLAAFGPETENLRCAIDWAFSNAGTPDGTSGLGIALVAASGAVSEEMSLQADLRRWTQTAMAHLTDATPPGEAAQVIYLFTLQQKRLGAVDVPAERLRAIELFRAAGDRLGLSRALRQTAIARAMPGDTTPGVLDMLAEAVALIRHLAPHKDLATALAHTGSVYFLNADHETSRTLNQQALSMRQLLGDRSGVIASAVNLAELLFLDGDTEAALAYATQAEAEARNRNAQSTLALILSNMAGYRLACGDAVAGAAAAAESLALSRAIGQDYLAVMCLEHLALALALTGRTEPAASLLGFADRHYAATGQTRERLEQAGHDRLIAALARDLPPAKLGALRAEGAAWSTEQADAAAQTEEAVTC